jgi:uncharacterized membrane protein (UPF0127 family)
MQIINRSRNAILAQNAALADTPFTRIRGLLGKKELKPGEGLIISPCNSVHSFFMRFTIDVLFLDKEWRVIKTLPNFKPFRLSPIYFRAHLAIELPSGTVDSTHTHPGDTLALI